MHPLRARGGAANQQTAVRVPLTTRGGRRWWRRWAATLLVIAMREACAHDANWGRGFRAPCNGTTRAIVMHPATGTRTMGFTETAHTCSGGQLLNSQPCDTRENGSRPSQNVPHIRGWCSATDKIEQGTSEALPGNTPDGDTDDNFGVQ